MASKNKALYPSSHENDRIANLEYHKSRMRKCHDCGEPTTDYRCTACRSKWRIKHGISPNMSDSEE
jgi:recombinational DNA repair protein RecR